jgi:hypothetical protein
MSGWRFVTRRKPLSLGSDRLDRPSLYKPLYLTPPEKRGERMAIQTLYDIPGFDGLRDVTRRFGCDLTVHGGFVRRLATWLRDHDNLPDPEELSIFSSDIDMVHSGTTADTEAISTAVIEAVPFGEAIRWQIRSVEENAIYAASTPYNGRWVSA